MKKIGAAYIRVSDERQDEYSPDSQLKLAREYAAKEGYYIPDEYVFYDDGISGRSAAKRNEFNRMIAFAKDKSHPFDAIFVWKFSRFARNQEESIVYKNLLAKKGVIVKSVSEPIPEGHFGTLIERIIEWMDEFYLINLSTEVHRGMQEKASRGEPICFPAYGYDIIEGKYVINKEQAPFVKEIFSRFASGESMRGLSHYLASVGVKTKHGNPPESRFVEYMLNNPVYIGKMRYSSDSSRAISQRKYNDPSIITVDGKHEPIISLELWDAAQKRLAEIKARYCKYEKKTHTATYPLHGIFKCSSCGATLHAVDKRTSLQCNKYVHGLCHDSHNISMKRAESSLIEALEQMVQTLDFQIVPKESTKDENGIDYDRLISTEEKKLERAHQAYIAGIDTLEQYGTIKKHIEKVIAGYEKEKAKATRPSTLNKKAYTKALRNVISLLRDPQESPEAKNVALRTIVHHVTYDKKAENFDVFLRDIT